MELDRITVVLRPRGGWEGADLGFALARHWFKPLWLLWWLTALPLALLCLGVTGGRPDLWLLVLWWLKPVYELPLLVWTSRALFGKPPPRALPRVARASWRRIDWSRAPRLLPYLLWRRLSPRRAFLMPLVLLEGLGGRAARQRRRVLNAGGGTPTWLTLVCYHFEIILWGGLLLALFFLVPEELPRLDLGAAITDSESWAYWLSVVAYLLAFSVIAPFYVCAGFALYLTRRTELEAWDLELAFRKAGEWRHRSQDAEAGAGLAPGRAAAGLLVGALALLTLWLSPLGTPRAEPVADPDQTRTLIEEILEDPDFGGLREIRVWVPIASEDSAPEVSPLWSERLAEIAVTLGRILKWGLLGLALVAMALLALRIRRDWRPRWRLGGGKAQPESALGIEALIEDTIPGDIPAAVRALLARGDRRGALSLLYRASLGHLAGLGLDIPDGATEGDCLALAIRALPESALDPLERLTREWQRLAYAHRVPSQERIQGLLVDWCRWTGAHARTGP